jgi:hypothetical protein
MVIPPLNDRRCSLRDHILPPRAPLVNAGGSDAEFWVRRNGRGVSG